MSLAGRAGSKLWRLVVTRNVVLIAITLAFVGFVTLRVSFEFSTEWAATKELAKELGTTLFGLGVIAFIWELFARRAFTREILDSVDLADEVAEAGLLKIAWNYNLEIPWKELFEQSTSVDLFFSYAQTWRNNNYAHIERLAQKQGARLRVILPDPNDAQTMAELDRRFGSPGGKTADLIRESIKFYTDLPQRYPSGVAVECRVVATCPLMAIYVFSESAVLSLHSHQNKRLEVPTVLVAAKRPVYNFLVAEIEALYARSQPAPNP